jgi:sugar fermentation stimulation protein A
MSISEIFLRFPKPHCEVVFLDRPQRFLAIMQFEGNREETVYCANPGAMTGLLVAGNRAVLWDSKNLKRKRRYTWRAVEFQGNWVGTDTHLSNRIVEEIIKAKLLPEFESVTEMLREQTIEEGVRVDFVLKSDNGDCLVEVKSASIVLDRVARYPDSKTPRGVKQLGALTRQVKSGRRALLLFLVQRSDVNSFCITKDFDSEYAKAFDEAVAAGVEVLGVAVTVCPEGFSSPRILRYGADASFF